MAALTAATLAARLGGDLRPGSEPARPLEALAAPGRAGPGDVTFVALHSLAGSTVGACITLAGQRPPGLQSGAWIEVSTPRHAVARTHAWLPLRRTRSGVLVPPAGSASPPADAGGGRRGYGCIIEAGAVVGPEVDLGDYVRIAAGARVVGDTVLGNRVEIGAGCVIGESGFAYLRDGTGWLRMPTFGGVLVQDDVVIGSGTAVHAGVFGDTVIGRGSALDSHVVIGHDASIGAGCMLAAQSAIAGAAALGRGCTVGARSGVGEGVRVADRVTITAMSMVTRSIDEADARYASGWPAEPSRTWWRRVARLRRLTG